MHDAPQHRPRPLPLFLQLLRSETTGSPDRLRAALAGLKRYQQAPRASREGAQAPVILRAGRASLRDYGRAGDPAVIFVPSLINPPEVLDLTLDASLLRWLAGQGLRPLLVDWGAPLPSEAALDIGGHVDAMLLPLIERLGEPAQLVGYCLGGTMALAAAAHRAPVSLVLIATPWSFAGFPQAARDDLVALWRQAEPLAERLGLLPMEVLQTSFWRLDPARTIAKFEAFGRLDPASTKAPSFVALEDWANDGPPLTWGAGRQLLADFFGTDLTGRGAWQVAGRRVDPAALACPLLNIVSTIDRIVPAASAAPAGLRVELALGHVGMIVGGRALELLWKPLADWLRRAAAR